MPNFRQFCSYHQPELRRSALRHACQRSRDAGTFLPVPARKQPEDERKFQVGDRVSVTLHTGLIVEGTVRAVISITFAVTVPYVDGE